MMSLKRSIVCAAMYVLPGLLEAQSAELRLHNYYTDNMVLQRDKPLLIKGWGSPGNEVTASFNGQTQTAKADDKGAWSITLQPMTAEKSGHELTVKSAGKSVILKQVLVGDVLIFARQTTIDVSLGSKEDGRKAAAAYQTSPLLRSMRIKTTPAKDSQDDLRKEDVASWTPVDKDMALAMSAAAFYLGRDLIRKVDVPIGIVDIDMGHRYAAAWLSPKALNEMVEIYPREQTADMRWYMEKLPAEADAWASGVTRKKFDDFYRDQMKGKGDKPSLGISPLEYPYYPSAGYNTVIHPLRGIAAKGVLLQLGNDYQLFTYSKIKAAGKITDRAELDRAWAQSYFFAKAGSRMTPTTLPLIPRDWRRAFGEEALPIGMIMPPGSDSKSYGVHNMEVRELQRRMQQVTPGLGLIMPGTEHIPLSGEPADEKLLAERCGKWLLGAVYKDQQVVPSGPIFARLEILPNQATIFFKEGTAQGLTASGNALEHFEAAGVDNQFVPIKARIDGQTLLLTSDDVYTIKSIRYNWSRKPDQGLVNSAGLPVLPFTTQSDWTFNWWPGQPPVELPEEYHTLAKQWRKSDVAIFNGSNHLTGGDSQPNPNDLGPTGIQAAPFGPNLYIHAILPGSAADGKLLPDDLIYGVNGKDFGLKPDDKYHQFAAGITHAESEAGGGKLKLGVRRKGNNIDVELKLDVLGTYSATAPYHCPKTEKIVERAEAWMEGRFRRTTGELVDGTAKYHYHGDELFLLASGKPEHLGMVRRVIYAEMATLDPKKNNSNVNWWLGYDSMLFGEYYHRTGDSNVLPYLKSFVDRAAETQIQEPKADPTKFAVATSDQQVGGWRTKFDPGIGRTDYGLMAAAGMPCVMGMQLAKEAGLDIDDAALARGIRHFNKGRAEYGFVEYAYTNLRLEEPRPIDPNLEANGLMNSMNGKLGTAAVLFSMLDGYGTATDICSRYCVYGYNRTRTGHGGMFFNNFWTPLGAHAAGEKGFMHFMQGQTWWRELYRRDDGSFTQAGRGGIGVAYALHLVAHHKRLRMLGAPRSAFGANPPEYLKPALAAHTKKDYALAEELIQKEMKERIISADDKPVVEHLLESVQTVKKSVEHDLGYVEKLIQDNKHYYATSELQQLQGVVARDNPRLLAIENAIASPQAKAVIAKSAKEAELYANEQNEQQKKATAARESENPVWVPLTASRGDAPENEATIWRMSIHESRVNAPKGWMERGFDDSGWDQTTLPISWHVSHDALFRGTFTVKDKKSYDALRVEGLFFRQENVHVYLNGELVAMVNNIERGGSVLAVPLTEYAMKLLRNGENTIAVVTSHQERWGKVKGDFSSVDSGGFRIRVDARKVDSTKDN